jgi:hypothetical protein
MKNYIFSISLILYRYMMKEFKYSPDKYLDSLYRQIYPSPYEDVSGSEECLKISEALRGRLMEILAIDKIPAQIKELKPEIVKTEDRGCFIQETISLELCEGWNTLCYLLTPKLPLGSAVIAVCGHGYGCRQIIRQGKRGGFRAVDFLGNYQKNFAIELAKRGNSVIAYEPVGFGEACKENDRFKPFFGNSCRDISLHTLMYGFTTASLRIYQAIRCADLLEAKGFKDLGCMGISGGGLVALYFACLDERIKRVVISGYINTFRDSVMSVRHCPDNYIPGILAAGEIFDFASAIAPRKLLVESGSRDRIFPRKGVQTAIEHISRIYREVGAEDNFSVDLFEGRHEISGRKSYTFFNEWKP